MKTIKILHQSCCGVNPRIRKQIEKVAAEKNVEVAIQDVTDMIETMQFGTTEFPSLVIDGKVFNYRQKNTDEDVAAMLA
ncbi:thioredoxin family protein [Flammeovirga agarivorans]|uniref:Thioredoxin family protein n=1 Tax=Flammeovirga agarivorans TaxID=2726742 RepID=A0A7X8XUX5_9BACT|nr:thioredoxin family protein [Flammeovirga agarivorans]NLR90812.1 thioredoxin family protein [Flammeovirga agarivorans]